MTSGTLLFHEARSAFGELLAMEEELHALGQQLELLPHDAPEHAQLLERYGELQEQFRHRRRLHHGGRDRYGAQRVWDSSRTTGIGTAASFPAAGRCASPWRACCCSGRTCCSWTRPTNHLDIEARNWLELYLCSYPGSVILVSHDRFFMDQVCSRIAEVWNHTIADYHCSYSRYLVQREERVSALREAKRIQDEEVQKTEDFIRPLPLPGQQGLPGPVAHQTAGEGRAHRHPPRTQTDPLPFPRGPQEQARSSWNCAV